MCYDVIFIDDNFVENNEIIVQEVTPVVADSSVVLVGGNNSTNITIVNDDCETRYLFLN